MLETTYQIRAIPEITAKKIVKLVLLLLGGMIFFRLNIRLKVTIG